MTATGTTSTDSQHRGNRWFCHSTAAGRAVQTRDKFLPANECRKYMLWIDGVGGWQLCCGPEFVIGAPSFEKRSADIALLANVSRRHATLKHTDSEWHLKACQETAVSGKLVTDSHLMRSGDQICLAERVRLGFRVPSVLSSSAVIDFESDHRPSHSVDGIILMTDHCLLGPRRDHHIHCSQWPDVVVLFEQGGKLRCRSKTAISVDGHPVRDSAELTDGAMVSGEELRFRVERMR